MILSLLYYHGKYDTIIYPFTSIGKCRSRKNLPQVMHTGDLLVFPSSKVCRDNSPRIPCSENGRFMNNTPSNTGGFYSRITLDGLICYLSGTF